MKPIYCIIDRNDPTRSILVVGTEDQIKEW